MVVTDGNGLHVDGAQPHEITLAETTLRTIHVPQKLGCPKEPVVDKAYDSREFRRQLRRRGIKPTLLSFLPTLLSPPLPL